MLIQWGMKLRLGLRKSFKSEYVIKGAIPHLIHSGSNLSMTDSNSTQLNCTVELSRVVWPGLNRSRFDYFHDLSDPEPAPPSILGGISCYVETDI